MMQYPLCLPVVFHGLLYGHTRQTQLEIINRLARGDFDTEHYSNDRSLNIKKEDVSNYLKGKAVIPLEKIEKLDEEKPIQTMMERVRTLELDTDIEFFVSAFHSLFLTKCTRLDKSEIELFDSFIFVDNDPVRYIAEAVMRAFKYSAKTDTVMTPDFIDELHNLHLQDGVQNLFKLSINEQIHYQIMKGIPEHITDKTLRGIWEKVLQAEIEKPGSVSTRTFRLLEQLTPKGARAFILALPIVLNQVSANSYFLLDTTEFKYDPLETWLFHPAFIIHHLQESELIQNNHYSYLDHGGIIFANRNQELCVKVDTEKPLVSMDEGFREKIYPFTEAGDELCNIIGAPNDDDFLYLLAHAMNLQFGPEYSFSVHRYPRRLHEGRLEHFIEDFDETDLLASFPVEETKERIHNQALDSITFLAMGMTNKEIDEAYGKELAQEDDPSES